MTTFSFGSQLSGYNHLSSEYSLLRLMGSLRAGCKALRNSDYSSPEIRHKLINEIASGWEMVLRVLVVLSPILAKKGQANVDGTSFVLVEEDFSGTIDQRFFQILSALPSNVSGWYRDDFFSSKMAPLLYKYLDSEDRDLVRHLFNLIIVNKRPKGWVDHIEKVIFNKNKNSFYLADLYAKLKFEYKYGYLTQKDLSDTAALIKKSVAKHIKGIERPGEKVVKSKAFDRFVPTRGGADFIES